MKRVGWLQTSRPTAGLFTVNYCVVFIYVVFWVEFVVPLLATKCRCIAFGDFHHVQINACVWRLRLRLKRKIWPRARKPSVGPRAVFFWSCRCATYSEASRQAREREKRRRFPKSADKVTMWVILTSAFIIPFIYIAISLSSTVKPG